MILSMLIGGSLKRSSEFIAQLSPYPQAKGAVLALELKRRNDLPFLE
jgi:hypothetical protein